MNNVTPSLPQETILLVDDSTDNLRLLSTMLQTQGYRVKKSISGEFALQSLEVIEPDLILLDINMPGMDGYQVCKTLKTKKNINLFLLFLSVRRISYSTKLKLFRLARSIILPNPFS